MEDVHSAGSGRRLDDVDRGLGRLEMIVDLEQIARVVL